jgi:hypothetical protein
MLASFYFFNSPAALLMQLTSKVVESDPLIFISREKRFKAKKNLGVVGILLLVNFTNTFSAHLRLYSCAKKTFIPKKHVQKSFTQNLRKSHA